MIALSSQTGHLHQGKDTIYTFSAIKIKRSLEVIGNLPFATRNALKHIHSCENGSFPVPYWWCIQGEGRKETHCHLVRYYQRDTSWLCRLWVLFAVISLTLEIAFRWDFVFKLTVSSWNPFMVCVSWQTSRVSEWLFCVEMLFPPLCLNKR